MKFLAGFEFLFGSLLLLAALYFGAGSIWCFDPHAENCGMVYPLVAFYAFLLGTPMIVAGALHWRRRLVLGLLALLPSFVLFFYLIYPTNFSSSGYHLTVRSSGQSERFAIDAAA